MSNYQSNLSRRRFLSNFAFASTALATGAGSWVIRPDWANAASDPIKVGIATDLTGPIGYAGNADANVAKAPFGNGASTDWLPFLLNPFSFCPSN